MPGRVQTETPWAVLVQSLSARAVVRAAERRHPSSTTAETAQRGARTQKRPQLAPPTVRPGRPGLDAEESKALKLSSGPSSPCTD